MEEEPRPRAVDRDWRRLAERSCALVLAGVVAHFAIHGRNFWTKHRARATVGELR